MKKAVGTRVAILLLSAVLALGAPAAAAQDSHLLETYNVELLGQIGGGTSAVAVQGTIAYIGVGFHLVILDVSTPANPLYLGQTAALPGIVQDVAVVGRMAYIADGSGGLRIVDVSDLTSPSEVGAYDTSEAACDVAVVGSTAYVAAGESGLRIIDISDPTSPSELGTCDTPGNARSAAVVGSTAYIADGWDGDSAQGGGCL